MAWALFHFDWRFFLASLILWQLTGVVGLSIGYHRLLSHRSFQCSPFLKRLLLALGCLAGQLGPMRWSRIHRLHHRHAETRWDPHSPRIGFWHAHFGWLLQLERRAAIPGFKSWPRDLLRDPDAIFFERAYPFLLLASLGAYALFWGWKGLLWLGVFRIGLALHSIWSINSVGHRFGYRNFATPDDSKNHKIWSLFTGGEGLHNNHHAHPTSAGNRTRPGEWDAGWLILRGLAALGLVWNLKHYDPATGTLSVLYPRKVSDVLSRKVGFSRVLKPNSGEIKAFP